MLDMLRVISAASIVFGAVLQAPAAFAQTAMSAASVNDTARFLAGIEPDASSPLAPLTKDAGWQQHARTFDQAWTGLENRQLSKIRIWSAKHLTSNQPTAFYMFSGPDYLYVDAVLPNATTYVMSGLEPVGEVPHLEGLSRGTLGSALRELRASLNSVLSYSFFRTKDMRTELSSGHVTGTLPILFVFLSRAGKTIEDVTYITLDGEGAIQPSEATKAMPASGAPKGVKITFSGKDGVKRTLYYFSTDVSNSGVKTSGFLKFCDALGQGDSFVKSASYLMHSGGFSEVRNFLITHSKLIVQDDSGIPVRYLAQGWQLNPFGAYVGPISLFAGKSQSKLYEIFRKNHATPIDFGIGYQWHSRQSNILVALRDGSPLASPVEAEANDVSASRSPAAGESVAAKSKPPQRGRAKRNEKRTVANPPSWQFLWQ